MQENILRKINHTLIVIAGPTAIGKTSLSIRLAKHFSCPVISADSRQFFKEMHIGTAKPNETEMQGVTHYFIGSHSITDNYNVGKYETEAIALLDQLFKINETLILVGGSGLYTDAVCNGFDELPEADEAIRNQLNVLLKNKGIEGLQELLQKLDPVYYNQVDLQNPQRMSRALEVCLITGSTYSNFRKDKVKKRNFNCIKIGLTTDREILYKRINLRVDQMMEDGLLEEVKSLEHYKHLNALQTVGYKEFFDCLPELEKNKNDAATYNTMLKKVTDQIKQNTRRFAKRQLTWFRRDEQLKWFEPQDVQSILTYIEESRIRNTQT